MDSMTPNWHSRDGNSKSLWKPQPTEEDVDHSDIKDLNQLTKIDLHVAPMKRMNQHEV